jgi:hypothetical protein
LTHQVDPPSVVTVIKLLKPSMIENSRKSTQHMHIKAPFLKKYRVFRAHSSIKTY